MSSGIQAHAPHGSSQPTHGSAKALDDCPSWRASTIATIATIRVSPFITVSFQLDRQSGRRDTLIPPPVRPPVACFRGHPPPGGAAARHSGLATDAAEGEG